eukprot:5750559-Pyramimonas_sp.AAC.1
MFPWLLVSWSVALLGHGLADCDECRSGPYFGHSANMRCPRNTVLSSACPEQQSKTMRHDGADDRALRPAATRVVGTLPEA